MNFHIENQSFKLFLKYKTSESNYFNTKSHIQIL